MNTPQECSGCQCGQTEGEGRKRAALALLTESREVHVRRARRALLEVLLQRGSATMDHVRRAVELPADINPRVFGAVPGALSRRGIIRASGYAKTSRPTAHGRPLTVWRLADREAAERWLRDHPDLLGSEENAAENDDHSQRLLFPSNPNAAGGPGPAARCLSPDHASPEETECLNQV